MVISQIPSIFEYSQYTTATAKRERWNKISQVSRTAQMKDVTGF